MTNYKLFFVYLLTCLVFTCGLEVKGQSSMMESAVKALNKVRSEGCRCGRKYYHPVQEIQWNDTLYLSAYDYASQMSKKKFFSHIGPDGKNIGQRVDNFGYNWKYIGENLGKGQSNIDELIMDWKNSYTHCKLMMDPRFKEMGLATKNGYWVLHLGMKM